MEAEVEAATGGDTAALALLPPPPPPLLLAATVDPLSRSASEREKGRGLGGRDELGDGRGRGDGGLDPRGETGLEPGTAMGVHGREMRSCERGLGGAAAAECRGLGTGLGLGVPARSRCMCSSCASACFCDGWLRSSRSSASVAGLIRAHTRSAVADR